MRMQALSLQMGIDHLGCRSRRDVSTLSTFWVDSLPPGGACRTDLWLKLQSQDPTPSNPNDLCFMPLHSTKPNCIFTWSECVVPSNVSFTEVLLRCSCGIGPVGSLPLSRPLMLMINGGWMINGWYLYHACVLSLFTLTHLYCWLNWWDQISVQRAKSRDVIELWEFFGPVPF